MSSEDLQLSARHGGKNADLAETCDRDRSQPRWSHRLLAFIGVITGDDLDDALQAAQKALSLQPGNQEFALIAAQLMLRKQRIGEARTIAENLVRSPVSAYVKTEAESVLRAANELNSSKNNEPFLLDVRTGEAKPIILQRKDLTDDEVRGSILNAK